MKKNESIKKIMSKNVVHCTINNKISDIKNLMNKHHIRHVPILSGKKLVGLVSQIDLLRASFSDIYLRNDQNSEEQLDNIATISDIMTTELKSIRDTSTVRDAALLLLDVGYNSLPVIDENDEIVGIVTSKDLIRYLLEQY